MHHDERVCDFLGRDSGTVRAREGPNPFGPLDLNDFERWWCANFTQHTDDGEPETRRRRLADNQKRIVELRAILAEDQKLVDDVRAILEEDQILVHDVQADLYLRCSYLHVGDEMLKGKAEDNWHGEARSLAEEIGRSMKAYLEEGRLLDLECELRRSEQALSDEE